VRGTRIVELHGTPCAYACEAYARIVERAPRLRDRPALAEEYARGDEGVDRDQLVEVVRGAAGLRNGWK
jgi:hypothetical protein